jgi:hypothetical protein
VGSAVVRVIAPHRPAFSSAKTTARHRCPSKTMVPLSIKADSRLEATSVVPADTSLTPYRKPNRMPKDPQGIAASRIACPALAFGTASRLTRECN